MVIPPEVMSEQVVTTIDSEVKRIIDECYDRAKTIIKEHEAVLL